MVMGKCTLVPGGMMNIIIPVMLALVTTSVLLLLPLWHRFAKPDVRHLGKAWVS
jgi:hypothetical protein